MRGLNRRPGATSPTLLTPTRPAIPSPLAAVPTHRCVSAVRLAPYVPPSIAFAECGWQGLSGVRGKSTSAIHRGQRGASILTCMHSPAAGFVIGVIWALVWPTWGNELYHLHAGTWKVFSTLHIAIIFFCFGITLETSSLKSAFKSYQVLIMGFLMILVVTALTGFIPLGLGFNPEAFGIGLAVFAACPTSLSQGVTVVIQGYGNAALALLLVVLTNLVSSAGRRVLEGGWAGGAKSRVMRA